MADINSALELIKKQETVISAQNEKLLYQDEAISSQCSQIELLNKLNAQLGDKNRILSRQLGESKEAGRKLAGILFGVQARWKNDYETENIHQSLCHCGRICHS